MVGVYGLVGVGAVEVGVVETKRGVSVIRLVEVIWGFSFNIKVKISWVVVDKGVLLGRGRGSDTQAGTRIMTKHATNKHLNTIAVYHKIYLACEILNPCE
jgi:hypothetical protein